MKYYVDVNGVEHAVELTERLGEIAVTVNGSAIDIDYEDVDGLGQGLIFSEGNCYGVSIEGDERKVGITIAGHFYDVSIEDERERAAAAAERAAARGGGLIKSVMPGIVVELLVEEGQAVVAGQPLLILEAMKMQNEIEAAVTGTVSKIHVEAGQAVGAGEKLVVLESEED